MHPSLPYSAITLQIGCLCQIFEKLHPLRRGNMCVKVSDTVLPPITGLHITFGTYMKALETMGGEFNAPFPPILSHHAPNWLPEPVFEKLHPLWKGNMCVKVSDTVLPPITGLHITFGTYMKALDKMVAENSMHPSLPYSAITLQIGCLGQIFEKLHPLRKGNMCVKVSDTVLPPITGLHITFRTYMEGFGHNGQRIQRTFPSFTISHHAPNWLPEPIFEILHPLRKGNMCVKVSDTVLPPITGLHITFGTYYEGFGHNGQRIQRTFPSHTQPSCSKLAACADF